MVGMHVVGRVFFIFLLIVILIIIFLILLVLFQLNIFLVQKSCYWLFLDCLRLITDRSACIDQLVNNAIKRSIQHFFI